MSEIYDKYCSGKSRPEYMGEIVNAIAHGRLKGNELETLISELSKSDALNDTAIPRKSQDKWTVDYLELLTNEVVRGVFSANYLRYLAEVSQHANKKKSRTSKGRSSNSATKAVGVLVLIAIAAIVVIALVNTGR
jgi:ABC-type anion transport system duplicated permease subunit